MFALPFNWPYLPSYFGTRSFFFFLNFLTEENIPEFNVTIAFESVR